MRITVATFNTAGAVASSSRFYKRWQRARCRAMYDTAAAAIDSIAATLRAHEVDLVALQETDTSYAGGDELVQWERLAAALGMDSRFAPAFSLDLLGAVRVRSGIATLSRFPIRASRAIRLPRRRRSPRERVKALLVGEKQALHCALHVDGRELHVVNAHLTHDSTAQREAELAALLDDCAALQQPTLLCGDLNFTPAWPWPAGTAHPQPLDDQCMTMLRAFRDRYRGTLHADARLGDFAAPPDAMRQLATCPADAPRYKFDWVMLLDPANELSLDAETPVRCDASDHLAVVAHIAPR